MVLLEPFQQHLLRILVGNVPDHDSSTSIDLNLVHINYIRLRLLITDRSPVTYCWTLHDIVVVVTIHLHHHGHGRVGILSRGIGHIGSVR